MDRTSEISFAELNIRPGCSSLGGFLGSGESLADVLKSDDETVRRLGLTHGQIADRIEYFIKAVGEYPPFKGQLVDGNFEVKGNAYRGCQECPWNDGQSSYSNSDWEIVNQRLVETLSFLGLIVHLIRDHQFYEGKGSSYRVDPENAARALEII